MKLLKINILIYYLSLLLIGADNAPLKTALEYYYSENNKEVTEGISQLQEIVGNIIKDGGDDAEIREELYKMLHDEREGYVIDEEFWEFKPSYYAYIMLIKLTKYQNYEFSEKDGNVDVPTMIAFDLNKRGRFKKWYEKKYIHEKPINVRVKNPSPTPERVEKSPIIEEEVKKNPSPEGSRPYWIWALFGLLAFSVVLFVLRVMKR